MCPLKSTQTNIIASGLAAFKWQVDSLNLIYSTGNDRFILPFFELIIQNKSSYQNLCRNSQFTEDNAILRGPVPAAHPYAKQHSNTCKSTAAISHELSHPAIPRRKASHY